jgi:hypothetical protein
LIVVTAGVAAAVAVFFAWGPASRERRGSSQDASAPTCSDRLLTDWSDGRIDGVYPIRCYRETIRNLPTDVRVYSSAEDDIQQALSQRIVQNARPAGAGGSARTPS